MENGVSKRQLSRYDGKGQQIHRYNVKYHNSKSIRKRRKRIEELHNSIRKNIWIKLKDAIIRLESSSNQ